MMPKKETLHIDLDEALGVLDELHSMATKRMIHGTKVHGTEMVRKPFEELEEELADAFNYIVLAFIKTLKSCGGYKNKWSLKRLPDIQKTEIKDEVKGKGCSHNRDEEGNRKSNKGAARKKRV